MKTVTLNNGIKMPILGFGVLHMEDAQICEQAVYDAITAGYRLIDTASGYRNEEAVGKAVKKCGIPREEIFITTKLWIQETGYENTKKAFEKSLNKLQLDYLDLYLIHQPYGDVYGSWRAMEELYNEGRIRSIGVSNFLPDRLVDLILHNNIVPAINQVETHPFCQQTDSATFMNDYNVQIESWSPLAGGKMNIFQNEILGSIAEKYNKSIPQIILRWLTQRDIIAIPKTVHKERMVENFNIFDFELTNEDIDKIKELDTGRCCFLSHRDPETVKMLGTLKFEI